MKKYLLGICLFLSFNLFSQNAIVYAVHDGDSYKVKMNGSDKKVWVRLQGVDCPEVVSNTVSKAQPYAKIAGDSIRSMIKQKHVLVDSVGVDAYGRIIAKVFLYRPNEIINLTEYIVENGLGWMSGTGLPDEYAAYIGELQADAILNKRGLWGGSEKPVAPRTWRTRYRRF